MPAPENSFKRRMAAGDTTYGCWLGLGHSVAAEVAATAGFDWLLIDNEHAPNDIPTTLAQLQTLAAFPVDAIVRLESGDPVGIKRMLDLGAQTLLIPMVESAEDARALVSATRYPPGGTRGVGAALGRASLYNAVPDYTETADDQVCLILQVENRKGLNALDEILDVDGVDGVFVGPADLSADLGYPGQINHPEARAAVMDAIARIAASEKWAGTLSTEPDYIAEARSAGARFLAVAVDVLALGQSLRQTAARYVE